MKKTTIILLTLVALLPINSWAQQDDRSQLLRFLSGAFPQHEIAFENLEKVCVGDSNLLQVLAARPGGINLGDPFIEEILTGAESMNGCAGNLITSANPICPGDFTTLTGSQTLGVTPVTFLWYNGSQAQSQTLSFNTQTNIWVQGTGGDGCSWFSDGTIWMAQNNITASISGNPQFCSGSFATLTASGGSQVVWSGPNGFTSTNWTINVNQPGLYTATVSNGGGCNGTASINVTMSQAAVISIAGPAGFCPGTSAQLTASSNVPNSSFSWNTGQSGPTLTTSTGGTYTVTATANGTCPSTASKTITAFPAPSTDVTVGFDNGVTTLNLEPGLSATWFGPNGFVSTNLAITVPNQSGPYVANVTNQNGCTGVTTGIKVNNKPCAPACTVPVAGFTFTINGALVTFTNTSTGTGPLTYAWNFGDLSNSMATNPQHAYQPGTYQVTLVTSNVCGPSVPFVVTLTIACPPPTAAFTFTTNGPTASFTSTSTGNGLTYAWNFGNGATSTAQNPTYSYTMAGSYTVTLKVTNSCGATNTIQKIVSVFFCIPLDAQFNLPQSGGLNLQFTNTSVGTNLTYFWTFGDGGTSTDEDPFHSYSQPGVFLVKLKITDACGNTDQVVKTLVVLNAVEPAGDRNEDVFKVYPTVTTSQFSLEGSAGMYILTDPQGRSKKLIKTE